MACADAPAFARCVEQPETWLRSQAVGILQQMRIEAPAPRSIAQEMALRVAALAATKPSLAEVEEEARTSPRRRGWDSTCVHEDRSCARRSLLLAGLLLC